MSPMETFGNWFSGDGVEKAYKALSQSKQEMEQRLLESQTKRNIQNMQNDLNNLFYPKGEDVEKMTKLLSNLLRETFNELTNKIMDRGKSVTPTIIATSRNTRVYQDRSIPSAEKLKPQKIKKSDTIDQNAFEQLLEEIRLEIQRFKRISKKETTLKRLTSSLENAKQLQEKANKCLKNWFDQNGVVFPKHQQDLLTLYGKLLTVQQYIKGGLNSVDYGIIAEAAVALYVAGIEEVVKNAEDGIEEQVKTDLINRAKMLQQGQSRAERTGLSWSFDFKPIEDKVEKTKDSQGVIRHVIKVSDDLTIELHNTITSLAAETDIKADVRFGAVDEYGISVKNWEEFGFYDFNKKQKGFSGLNGTSLLAAVSRTTGLEEKYSWALQSNVPHLLQEAHDVARFAILIDIVMGNFKNKYENANILVINNHKSGFFVYDIVSNILDVVREEESQLFKITGYYPDALEASAEQIQEFALRQKDGRSSIYTMLILNHLHSINVQVKFAMLQKDLPK